MSPFAGLSTPDDDVLPRLRKLLGRARSALAQSSPYGAASRNLNKVEGLEMAVTEIERLRALVARLHPPASAFAGPGGTDDRGHQ